MRDLETRRKRFLQITEAIGKELDARGVTDEDVERDFAAFKRHRRAGETPAHQPARRRRSARISS